MYNRITEHCFAKCSDNLFNRTISDTENSCVNNCVDKFVKVNHRILGVYVEVQQGIQETRLKEMSEMQQKLDAAAAQEALNKVDTTLTVE